MKDMDAIMTWLWGLVSVELGALGLWVPLCVLGVIKAQNMKDWLSFPVGVGVVYTVWCLIVASFEDGVGNYGVVLPKRYYKRVGGVWLSEFMWELLLERVVEAGREKGTTDEGEIRKEFERALEVLADRKVRVKDKEWKRIWENELRRFFK